MKFAGALTLLVLLSGCDDPEVQVPAEPYSPRSTPVATAVAPTTVTMLGTPPGIPDVTVIVPRAPLPEDPPDERSCEYYYGG